MFTVGDRSVVEGGDICACTLENAMSSATQKKKLLLRQAMGAKTGAGTSRPAAGIHARQGTNFFMLRRIGKWS